jgi:hypothetical protein
MAIKKYDEGGGGGGAKIFGLAKAVGGALTGNPALIASGAGDLASGTPMGRALGLAGGVKQAGKFLSPEDAPVPSPMPGAPPALGNFSLDTSGLDAMKRRYQTLGGGY